MKKNTFISMALITTLALFASGCGSKKKNGDSLENTNQGQRNGRSDGNTPTETEEQWLREFCDSKRDQGGVYYGSPDFQCKFYPVSFALSEADLQKIRVPQIVFTFSFTEKGIAQFGGRQIGGRAMVEDADNHHPLFELSNSASNLSGPITAGKYALRVTPGTSGLVFFMQACVDINKNYTTCRF